MAILEVRHLRKCFGDLEVISDISFDVNKGDVLAIIGPSGSGKSTLLRCINQLEQVNGGSICICGEYLVEEKDGVVQYVPPKQQRKIRLNIGLVFQNFNLFPHMSVLQNIIEAPLRVLKQDKQAAIDKAMELLEKMGLQDKANSYPCELSGGQQQRVCIARALALNPQVLFFDEPTSALDPELTGEVFKVLRDLAAANMTMVIVTHEMAFAQNIADHVIFMDGGVIVEQGTPEQLFCETQNERTRAFLKRYSDE